MPLPAVIPLFAQLASMLGASGAAGTAAAGTATAGAAAGTTAAASTTGGFAAMSGTMGRAALGVKESGFASISGQMGKLATATEAAQLMSAKQTQQESDSTRSIQQTTTNASRTIGTMASAVGKIGGPIATGAMLGPAGMAAGGLLAILAADKALTAWTNSLIDSQKGLGEWSGTVSNANTQMEYQSNLMDIERGQRTGSSYKFLTESRTASDRVWLKWEAAWSNFSNWFAGVGNYLAAAVGVVVEATPGVKQALDIMAAKSDAEASQIGVFLHDMARGNKNKDIPWNK